MAGLRAVDGVDSVVEKSPTPESWGRGWVMGSGELTEKGDPVPTKLSKKKSSMMLITNKQNQKLFYPLFRHHKFVLDIKRNENISEISHKTFSKLAHLVHSFAGGEAGRTDADNRAVDALSSSEKPHQ